MDKKDARKTIREISISARECFLINKAMEIAVDNVHFNNKFEPSEVKRLILKLAGVFIDDQETLNEIARISDETD